MTWWPCLSQQIDGNGGLIVSSATSVLLLMWQHFCWCKKNSPPPPPSPPPAIICCYHKHLWQPTALMDAIFMLTYSIISTTWCFLTYPNIHTNTIVAIVLQYQWTKKLLHWFKKWETTNITRAKMHINGQSNCNGLGIMDLHHYQYVVSVDKQGNKIIEERKEKHYWQRIRNL